MTKKHQKFKRPPMYAVEYKKSFRPKIKNPSRYCAVGVYGAENESKYNLIGPTQLQKADLRY